MLEAGLIVLGLFALVYVVISHEWFKPID